MIGSEGWRQWARPAAHRLRVWGTRAVSLGRQPRRDPVVVLGNHKSGTTAIAALLARHLDVSATLDMPAVLDWLPEPLAAEAFVGRYSAYFQTPVVKEPWLTLAYGELRAVLPEARFVLVVRDPRANSRSILDRLGLPGTAQTNPDGLAAVPAGWRELFPGPGHEAHYIDALAERWNRTAALAWSDPAPVVVRYEDFVADKAGVIANLAERLGRSGTVALSDAVERAYQPPGRSRGVPWSAYFGAGNLARLERRCAPGMAFFDYPSGG